MCDTTKLSGAALAVSDGPCFPESKRRDAAPRDARHHLSRARFARTKPWPNRPSSDNFGKGRFPISRLAAANGHLQTAMNNEVVSNAGALGLDNFIVNWANITSAFLVGTRSDGFPPEKPSPPSRQSMLLGFLPRASFGDPSFDATRAVRLTRSL